jgi:hypothetical protein
MGQLNARFVAVKTSLSDWKKETLMPARIGLEIEALKEQLSQKDVEI